MEVMNQDRSLALLPSESDWTRIKEIAGYAAKSGLLPSTVKSPEAAAIIALKGFELGLKPMVAFAHIHVVNGKPGCSAELMLASIYKEHPEADIQFVQMDEAACKIKARRNPDRDYQEISFTIEEAKAAGLLGKDNWKGYPTDMNRARAITRMKRSLWPEILMGLDHTPEELESSQPQARNVTPETSAEGNKQPQSIKNFAPQSQDEALVAQAEREAAKQTAGETETEVIVPEVVEPKGPSRLELVEEVRRISTKVRLTKAWTVSKLKELFGKDPAVLFENGEVDSVKLSDKQLGDFVMVLKIEEANFDAKKAK